MITKIFNLKYVHLFLSAIILSGVLVCVFPPDFFVFKVGAQFAVQIMLSYMALGLFFLVSNNYKLMFTSFAGCAALCLFLKYSTNSEIKPAKATNEDIIEIAHFDVSTTDDYQLLINEILICDADLISFQEVTPDWDIVLKESIVEKYPYSKTIVQLNPFGIAVYSKYPMTNIDTFICENVPNIVGTVALKDTGREICFISSHAPPPFYSEDYKKLRKHLRRIASYSNNSACPVITMGDYNAVPWSYEIQDFRSASNLSDSRRGFFPNADGAFSVFQLPSDHIFYSNQLECIYFEDIDRQSIGHIGVKGSYQFNNKYTSL